MAEVAGIGFTVTLAVVELAEAHTPLVTTARKSVVTVKLPVFSVTPVCPAILANGLAPVRDCHWMVPVLPVSVIVVEEPLQIVAGLAVAVPPTLVGFTVAVV